MGESLNQRSKIHIIDSDANIDAKINLLFNGFNLLVYGYKVLKILKTK